MRGWPHAQMLDYLDTSGVPTVDGFEQYQFEQDESDRAQFRWDAQCHQDPVSPKYKPSIIPNTWH